MKGHLMLCQTCDTRNLDDARFCANCGTQLVILQQPTVVPYMLPATRRKRRGWLKTSLLVSVALFALLAVCATVGEAVDGGSSVSAKEIHPPSSAEHESAASAACEDETIVAEPEALSISDQQGAFVQTVEAYAQTYQGMENKLQAAAQRAQRKATLAKLVADRSVQGWTGTLESLDTTANGKAFITMRLDGAEDITIATWDNALKDAGTDSLIQPNSKLYTTLADMSVGDRVTFRGTFVAGDEDYIAEASATEAESMTSPDFVMVFSEVTPQE